jgi:hypothetical protein
VPGVLTVHAAQWRRRLEAAPAGETTSNLEGLPQPLALGGDLVDDQNQDRRDFLRRLSSLLSEERILQAGKDWSKEDLHDDPPDRKPIEVL